MPDSAIKERIFDSAETLMWERGFHAVGLNEILAAVRIPKGSFYHYFGSKEQFGVELLSHYIEKATVDRRTILLDDQTQPDPISRLLLFFRETIESFTAKGQRCPCLILKLASEVTDLSEPMREALADGLPQWLNIIETVLSEALAKKMLPTDFDCKLEAAFLRDLMAGAIQRASILKSSVPLEQAYSRIESYLRNHSYSISPA